MYRKKETREIKSDETVNETVTDNTVAEEVVADEIQVEEPKKYKVFGFTRSGKPAVIKDRMIFVVKDAPEGVKVGDMISL